MSKKIAATKKHDAPDKARPSGTGQPKAEIKHVHNWENIEKQFEAEDEYEENPEEIAKNLRVNNPNRNYDKPDIDKPSYN